jgi:hypothetical protein
MVLAIKFENIGKILLGCWVVVDFSGHLSMLLWV